MTEIKKYNPSSHLLKAMLYGGTGAGKTTLSYCEPLNPLYLAVENGLLSLADKHPNMIEINTINDLREAIAILKTPEADEYKLIVVDSLSSLVDRIKDKLTANGQTQMDRNKWGELGDVIMGLFGQLLKLPKHVLFLCHEKDKDDAASWETIYDLNISGRGGTDVLKELDLIVRIYIDKEGNRRLEHKESFYTKCKCRSQAMRALDELPHSVCEWINILGSEVIWPSETIQKITVGKEAPTDKVADFRVALEDVLAKDSTEANRQLLKDKTLKSTKYTEEEKNWIVEKIDLY